MIEQVIKRDGSREIFSEKKIIDAIKKCFEANGVDKQDEYLKNIMSRFPFRKKLVHTEEIQDWIVKDLEKNISSNLSEAYQAYRDAHGAIRDSKYDKEFYDTIIELSMGVKNDVSSENANKNAKEIHVIRDLITGETSKKIVKRLYIPEEILKLHDEGVIHIHDMDYRIIPSETNCQLMNLKDMFENHTMINGKYIETPKSLRTATTIATQNIHAICSSQYGGITISLAHLSPYIRSSRKRIKKTILKETPDIDNSTLDKLTEGFLKQEIKDSIQTLVYQLNTLSTSNGQSPFITIWLRVDEYPEYEEETAILIEELLNQRIEGMVNEKGYRINPTFPKLIYCLDENNIHEDSKYFYLTKLSAKCTSINMVPDYISAKVMRELKEGRVYPAMGCRSFLQPWKNKDGEYQEYGRLNMGVISINIPYIALASNTVEEFYEKLNEVAHIVAEQQKTFADKILNSSVEFAPAIWKDGAVSRLPKNAKIGDDMIDNPFKHTISIGYSGICEAAKRFGFDYPSEEGVEFAEGVFNILNNVCDEYKELTKIWFSVYGTPQESLTTKFANALKTFDTIEGVNDHDYVTNSYHVPVTEEMDVYDKFKFEARLQPLSGGGAISYCEVPDVRNNPDAVLNIMRYIYDNIMYAEINTTNSDLCHKCGFTGEIIIKPSGDMECPQCGNTDESEMTVLRRMCGYLGNITKGTSKGRLADITNRVKHA